MRAAAATPGRPPARSGPASGPARGRRAAASRLARARRLAYENGIATPTMNMNDGWIRSQNVQPRHSTWSNCWASTEKNSDWTLSPPVPMPANVAMPPEAIASITKPR